MPSFLEVSSLIVRGLVLVVLVFMCGSCLAPRVIGRITHVEFDVDEAGFPISLIFGLGMAAISVVLSFSAGIGAFLIGSFTAGKHARFVLERIKPVRDLFIVIFFVSMGILVDPSHLLNPAAILVIVGSSLVGKYAVSYLGSILSGHVELAGNAAIYMSPREEFSFILAREATLTGISRTPIYPAAGAVVLVSTLASALFQILSSKLSGFTGNKPQRTTNV